MQKKDTDKAKEPAIIKKYANRRLYDTETSAYITLEDLCDRVKHGNPFIVVDAKSGQDLTRQILTQIIFDQESKGFHLLPTEFLRSVIGFYDHNMQDILQPYLDASMKSFTTNQEKMRGMLGDTVGKAMEGISPLNQLEEVTRHNMALFEKTMQMFNPFGSLFSASSQKEDAKSEEEKKPEQNSKK
ncbi:MAG: polyhydroxyalkanoate synthesis repressor PhaR [Rickettsiales bacterium]|jgi:polyhydroxyalkanoate synthesis repressor PhaR